MTYIQDSVLLIDDESSPEVVVSSGARGVLVFDGQGTFAEAGAQRLGVGKEMLSTKPGTGPRRDEADRHGRQPRPGV